MSVVVMNLFGLSVIQDGSGILSAPNPALNIPAGRLFSVDVANPCSGIRSLFALMMVSAIYANFTQNSGWKRLALFLSSIPLAIIGNLFRILLLTVGIITMGAPTAIGTLEHPTWFHQGAGFAIFLVALGGMVFIGHLLNSDPKVLWQRGRTLISPPSQPGKPTAPSSRHDIPGDIY
jgi:exosortase/archaeosortase family protein